MITWALDDEIKRIVDDFYFAYKMPDLEPFSKIATRYSKGHLVLQEQQFTIFQDSLSEIVNQIDEARFLSAISWAYLQDMSDEFKEFSAGQSPISIHGLVGALLAAHVNYDNPPSILFQNPSANLAKNRKMGTWFAANLLDSAIIRQLGVIDRILAILFVMLEIKFDTFKNSNEIIYPTASRKYLDLLYEKVSSEDKKRLTDILETQDFEHLKDFRNRFLHRSRVESELHGQFFYKVRESEPQLFRGLPSEDHIAYSFYAHTFVILPLIEFTKPFLENFRVNGASSASD
jgi:hypothetical protein